jgi:chemotaxis protein methyltransferase CheR
MNIFLRELRPYWPKADPAPLPFLRPLARRLGVDFGQYDRKRIEFVRLDWLQTNPEERAYLEAMFRIPIPRFYRDRDVFEAITTTVLPTLSESAVRAGIGSIGCWSAGCASGEEPYTLLLIWHFLLARNWPDLDLRIVATDVDDVMISRARVGCYTSSSVKDLPPIWIARAFEQADGLFCRGSSFRDRVDFRLQDITRAVPDEVFEVVLCRNLAFTYFDEKHQRLALATILDHLGRGGFLVIGKHETLPPGSDRLVQMTPRLPIYKRTCETSSETPVADH